MPFTINDGTTLITLPNALEWVDEYEYDNVKQDIQFLLGGGIAVSENLVTAGRPFTFVGGDNVWITKAVLDSIKLMRSVAEVSLTLILPDAREFTVAFDLSEPIKAKPILRKNVQDDGAFYTLEIKFLEL